MAEVDGINRCFAKIAADGYGVHVVARCCDFTHLGDVECVSSNILGSGEFGYIEGTEIGKCPGNGYDIMTGCTVFLTYSDPHINGWYIGQASNSQPGLPLS